MNFEDAVAILAPNTWTRTDKQLALEQCIFTFCADANEARDLIDALLASLKERYGRDDVLADVEHEARQMKEALNELELTMAKAYHQ